MNTTENAPAAAASPEPLAVRLLRIVALIGLVLILTFLFGLALVAQSSTAAAALEPLVSWTPVSKLPGVLTLAFVVLVPAALLFVAWRLRLLTWRGIVGGYVLAAPVLVYLAWDDPVVRRSVTLEEIAPAFPGAEKSFEVIMRYGKLHPLAAEFAQWRPKLVWTSKGPAEADAWREFLKKNRAALDADWESLAPQRAWWRELNQFDRIGDLTPARYDAEIISFQAFRTMSQRACAQASLQALDGKGDDAIETLLPILEVGYKMQPSARTLVRFMVGIVIERLALQTAEFVLAETTVSPAARARLAAALERCRSGETGARRLIAIEYAFALGGTAGWGLGDWVTAGGERLKWLRRPLNLVSPLVYNPRATLNLHGAINSELELLAAHREMGKFGPRLQEFFAKEGRPRFKNFMGAMLVESQPAYGKVVETYWKTEDQRTALLARVSK